MDFTDPDLDADPDLQHCLVAVCILALIDVLVGFLCDSCCIPEIDLVPLQRACCPYSHFSAGQVSKSYSFFTYVLLAVSRIRDILLRIPIPDPSQWFYIRLRIPILLFCSVDFKMPAKNQFFYVNLLITFSWHINISLQRLQVLKTSQSWKYQEGFPFSFLLVDGKDPDPGVPKNLRIRNTCYWNRIPVLKICLQNVKLDRGMGTKCKVLMGWSLLQASFFSFSSSTFISLFLLGQCCLFGIPDPDPAPDPILKLKVWWHENWKLKNVRIFRCF